MNEEEIGFASTAAGARKLLAELGGDAIRHVSSRQGWIIVRFQEDTDE